MADLKLFLAGNKKKKTNAFYPATRSLCDEKGQPLEWEIKALTTREYEDIREECSREIPIPGKRGQFRVTVDANEMIAKMIAASVVVPDLYDAELQDSYGARTPEELIKLMVDNPGEYDDLAAFVQNFNGFETLSEKTETAKN